MLSQQLRLMFGLFVTAEPSQKWFFAQYVSKNLALHLSVKIRVHRWQNAFVFDVSKVVNVDYVLAII